MLHFIYIHAMRTTMGVYGDSVSFLTIVPLILWWFFAPFSPSRPNEDIKFLREFLRSLLLFIIESSRCLMWCSRNYSHRASTHRGNAGAFTRGWQRRTRCFWMQPLRRPVASASIRSSSTARALSWLDNRCRPRKPWRDLPQARRSSRPERRRTARDYLRTTKRACECKGLPRDTR